MIRLLNQSQFVVASAFVLLELLAEALRRTDLGISKAAQWQDINVGQLHRQLEGKEHLSLLRMHKLPMATIRWFFWLGVLRFGIPAEERRALSIHLALMCKKRAARMDVQQQKEKLTA